MIGREEPRKDRKHFASGKKDNGRYTRSSELPDSDCPKGGQLVQVKMDQTPFEIESNGCPVSSSTSPNQTTNLSFIRPKDMGQLPLHRFPQQPLVIARRNGFVNVDSKVFPGSEYGIGKLQDVGLTGSIGADENVDSAGEREGRIVEDGEPGQIEALEHTRLSCLSSTFRGRANP